jgi:hypothetical protein
VAGIKPVEALANDEGKVGLLQPVHLGPSRGTLVVILDEPGAIGVRKCRRLLAARRALRRMLLLMVMVLLVMPLSY